MELQQQIDALRDIIDCSTSSWKSLSTIRRSELLELYELEYQSIQHKMKCSIPGTIPQDIAQRLDALRLELVTLKLEQ